MSEQSTWMYEDEMKYRTSLNDLIRIKQSTVELCCRGFMFAERKLPAIQGQKVRKTSSWIAGN